jgi:hypothetical protein
MSIPCEEFQPILNELQRKPLKGRSFTFGITTKRTGTPDYSRLCWMRPRLYKLLLDFAEKHVKIPHTTCVLNLGSAAKVYDTDTAVFAFGENSLVFFYQDGVDDLPAPSVIQKGTKFYFKRGDVVLQGGQPKRLPEVSGIIRIAGPVAVTFL